MEWIKRNILWRKRFYFLLTLSALLFSIYHFSTLRYGDEGLISQLNDNPFGYEAEVSYYQYGDRPMRYVEIGDDSKPLIVFVHGAPSSSAFWEDLMVDSSLLHNAKLLAVDRPGYGFSGFGRPEISVRRQAEAIAPILREKRAEHDRIIVHGSSYGGTVSARLAMDYPELVDGVLLQSASVAPEKEKTYWISYPTSHWAFKWLVPGAFRVANAEKLAHADQLRAMAKLWHRVRGAVIIAHGTADGLIYPDNACYAESQLTNASFLETNMFKGRGHDLLWTKTDFLKRSLLKLLHVTRKDTAQTGMLQTSALSSTKIGSE